MKTIRKEFSNGEIYEGEMDDDLFDGYGQLITQ